jgi:hypothetical protein
MIADGVELQPSEDEVLQEEPPSFSTIPVRVVAVDAPVRVQALPRKTGSTSTRVIGSTPVRVATADPYRAQLTIMSMDQNIYVAFTRHGSEEVLTSSIWPKLVPMVITAVTDVWVVSAAAQRDDTSVSITMERWATGSEHADQ